MSNIIIIAEPASPASPYALTIPSQSIQYRDAQLALSRELKTPTNDEEQKIVLARAGTLKAINKDVESLRVELTKPHLDAQRDYKAKCDDFRKPILDEVKRLEDGASAFQASKERIARQEREEEAKRLQAALKAERDAIAEQQRLERELAAAKTKKAQAAIKEKIEAAQINVGEAQADTQQAIEQRAEPVNTKVAGSRIAEDYDIVVVNIHALYAAHRQCVELTERKSAIKDLIRAGITDIPGVTLTPRVKVSARATKSPALQN